MMVPLRRALIVKEHGNLPYPEGTACAQVLIGGERGGEMGPHRLSGALLLARLRRPAAIFRVIAEVPGYVTRATSRIFPAATLNAAITPEYLGVGYIIGPRIAGVLVAGGVRAGWGSSRSSPPWCRPIPRQPAREARVSRGPEPAGRLRLGSRHVTPSPR